MDRTKIHVINEMQEALATYHMYQRMSEGKPEIYLLRPKDKILKKLRMLEIEYLSLGGSKYDVDYTQFQGVSRE